MALGAAGADLGSAVGLRASRQHDNELAGLSDADKAAGLTILRFQSEVLAKE